MLKLSVARRCGLKRKSETQGAPLRRLAVNPIEQVFAKLKHLLRKAVTLADRKCRGFEAPNPHGGISSVKGTTNAFFAPRAALPARSHFDPIQSLVVTAFCSPVKPLHAATCKTYLWFVLSMPIRLRQSLARVFR
jgi:hypothetical protein